MKTLDKTSVLLVEDDVDLRNTINENLKAVDYKVYATKKSIESLDLFKKYDIDICILDIEMTGIDGFALAAQIKMLNPDVPMIFLTSKGLLVNMLKDFEYGIDDYLTKPFSNEELLLRIKAVLHRIERNSVFSYTLGNDKINIGRFVFDAKNIVFGCIRTSINRFCICLYQHPSPIRTHNITVNTRNNITTNSCDIK